jgi:DNA-binding transcriptional LysR family regulator
MVPIHERFSIDDLNQVRIFAEVARTGGITAAAAKLGKPKSTVSRDISQLESSLGTALLTRNGRRLVLTEAGVLLAERALRILEEIDDAINAVVETTTNVRGTLKVQATYWLGHSLLVPLLPLFLERFPKLDVVLELKDFANLSTHDWDVQITAGTLADSSFVARKITEISLGLYANPKYFTRRPPPKTLEDLVNHDVVDKHWTNGTSPWIDRSGMQLVAVKPRLMVNDMIAIAHAIQQGVGIGWLPSFFVDQMQEPNLLINVLPELNPPSMPAYAIFPRRGGVISRKVRVFIDFIAEAFASRNGPSKWAQSSHLLKT